MRAYTGAFLCSVLWLGACAAPSRPIEPQKPVVNQSERIELRVGSHQLSVRIADDPAEHARGLAGVSELGDGEGMLFIYESSELRSFWMKGCLISLDIAFLDDVGRVLNVVTLAPPRAGELEAQLPRAESVGPARFVLEMRGGWWRDRGLASGTQILIPELAQ